MLNGIYEFSGMTAFEHSRVNGMAALKFTRLWLEDDVGPAMEAFFNGLGSMLPPEAQRDALQEHVAVQFLLAGRWAMSGFPTVDLGHKLAASYMATNVSTTIDVRAPWPAFAIRIPEGLVQLDTLGGDRMPVVVMFVTQLVNRSWIYSLMCNPSPGEIVDGKGACTALWANQVSADRIGGDTMPPRPELSNEDSEAPSPMDERTELLCRRMMLSVCLNLSSPEALRAAHKNPNPRRKGKGNERNGQLPDYARFELRSAITVDVRPAIHGYVERGGSSPKVQSLVAGHWKVVHYGKGHRYSKAKHVEAYWRGPLDGPVVSRTR